jgi:hypothetical protein
MGTMPSAQGFVPLTGGTISGAVTITGALT